MTVCLLFHILIIILITQRLTLGKTRFFLTIIELMNTVILIGNLGNAPEVKQFENGGKIANASIALNESYTNKQTGERVNKTEWVNLVFQNKQADTAEKYLTKGSKIGVNGKIRTRSYETPQGEKRYLTEVVVMGFEFLDSKPVETHQAEVVPNSPKNDLPF